MSRLRWGILSTADIAREEGHPGHAARRRAEVVAIASRDAGRAGARRRRRSGIPRAHGSYEALLADPDVDAVYIPLPEPPPRRVDDRRGRGRQARPVREAAGHDRGRRPARWSTPARRPGVHLMEAFMYRHHPSWVAVRELVASGRIGRLRAGPELVLVLQRRPGQHPEHPRRRRRRAVSTSAATRSTCRGCCSAPSRRTSRRRVRRDPATGVDVLTSAILEFDDGHRDVHLLDRTETDQRVHIYGDRGPDLDRHPVQHPARPADPRVRDRRRRSAGGARRPRSSTFDDRPTRTRPRREAFAAAVLDGTPDPGAAGGRRRQPAGHRGDLRRGGARIGGAARRVELDPAIHREVADTMSR